MISMSNTQGENEKNMMKPLLLHEALTDNHEYQVRYSRL